MFHKTTSFIFQKYGEIVNELNRIQNKKLSTSFIKLKDKTFQEFIAFDCDVFIKVCNGIVMLVVSNEKNAKEYERFVIHRYIKIKKGVYFNFLCISASAKVEIETDLKAKKTSIETFESRPVEYEPLISKVFIKEIFGYYYQVRNANYVFSGEKHGYWELTFIDHGELETCVDNETYQLKERDLIIYAPNQFHTQKTGKSKSCSYLTVLFQMDVKESYLLINRVYHANRDIHAALDNFIKASNQTLLYEDELMLCYIKEFIIRILQFDFINEKPLAATPIQQRFENELINEIIIYINDRLFEQITIEELCLKFSISRSSLQTLFKNSLGVAPKQYISDLKLNKSKLLIKESIYTISEVAGMLGYSSIHYFSRRFKQQFGLAPTDYAKTIYT